MVKSLPTPRHNVYPPELATVAELEALDLKPGSIRTKALLTCEHGDRSGMCGLHERSAASLPDAKRAIS